MREYTYQTYIYKLKTLFLTLIIKIKYHNLAIHIKVELQFGETRSS